MPGEVVDTHEEAAGLELAPLLVRRPLEAYLDELGIGTGPISATRIGGGASNVTFLLERGDTKLVLRRPPRPPLPPSAHDMVREARVQQALGAAGARVPRILFVCEDESILGVPFYGMEQLDGAVVTDRLPTPLDTPDQRRRMGDELIDALAEIHAVDWQAAGLEGFGKPTGYLERQVKRFSGLWEINKTRELPQIYDVAQWLDANRPESGPATVVHGDYRLGNVMYAPNAPARLAAVLDWELSTIGDPLADVGYLLTTWADRDTKPTVLSRLSITQQEGFPTRRELAERYEERTGRTVAALRWYEALALWKAAVFCEAIYGRWLRGEKEREGAFAATLEQGVPQMVEAAAACAEAA